MLQLDFGQGDGPLTDLITSVARRDPNRVMAELGNATSTKQALQIAGAMAIETARIQEALAETGEEDGKRLFAAIDGRAATRWLDANRRDDLTNAAIDAFSRGARISLPVRESAAWPTIEATLAQTPYVIGEIERTDPEERLFWSNCAGFGSRP